MNSASVIEEYQQRMAQLDALLDGLQARQGTVLAIALAGVVAVVLLFLSRRTVPVWVMPAPLPVIAVAMQRYSRLKREISDAFRLRRFYEAGVERVAETWAGKGVTGEEFEVEGHVYAGDLNLFGEGSLFERMCTARTHLGCGALARYLQEPVGLGEIQARQAAVQELMGRKDLRERLTLLGRYPFQQSHWKTFGKWLDSPEAPFPQWLKPAAMVSGVAVAVLALTAAVVPVIREPLLQVVVPLAALNGLVGLAYLESVRRVLKAATPVAHEINLIREGLEWLAGEKFAAAKLVELSKRASSAGAVIGRVKPWFTVMQERIKDWFYFPALLLMLGTQSAVAIERWRAQHGDELRDWLEAWGEFEALNAVACYAYENPEDGWAEVLDGSARFCAEELGHPLIAREVCVRNDVALNRFAVLSGSNMAGKSTLLRSIGLAAVMTYAGARCGRGGCSWR